MKVMTLALLSTLTFATAEAAVMKVITKATNPNMAKIYKDLAANFNTSGNCLDLTLVKVVQWSPANGRDKETVRQAMIRESFHRFVTSWFDEGIDTNRYTDAGNIDASEFGELATTMQSDLVRAMSDKTLSIYGGGAGGNNTSGTVYSVYDTKNDEILNLTNSNFASDSDCGD